MVHHLILCRALPGVGDEQVEWVLRETRIRLLKIAEVLAMRCGKRIAPDSAWDFFLGADFESMEKMSAGQADPVYQRFLTEVLDPHAGETLALSYESEPGKDVRYS